jgi:hypothetical protein
MLPVLGAPLPFPLLLLRQSIDQISFFTLLFQSSPPPTLSFAPEAPSFFHIHPVTSSLSPKIKLRNPDEGPSRRVNPQRRAPKSFASRILVSKSFERRILPVNYC